MLIILVEKSHEKCEKFLFFLHFRNGPTKLFSESWKHKKILAYYMVPAFLYCLYNNLTFQNLKIFDPTTYFMFMQMRLLMTGVIYQFLFNRKLSGRQWISLLILTLGCILQRIENYAPNLEAFHAVSIGSGLLLIALQVFEFFQLFVKNKLFLFSSKYIFFFFYFRVFVQFLLVSTIYISLKK